MKKIVLFFVFFMTTSGTILSMFCLKTIFCCCCKPILLTGDTLKYFETSISVGNAQELQNFINLYGINSRINGETMVHWAVLKNRPGVINFLVSHQADVNTTNDDGMTPLHLATEHDYIDCLRTLVALRGRIELDQKTYDHQTALDIALSKKSVPAIRVLVHAGADRSRIDWAVIQEALDSGNYETAILITQGHCTERDIEKVKKQHAAKLEKDKQQNNVLKQNERADRQKREEAWVSMRRYYTVYGYGYSRNYYEGY